MSSSGYITKVARALRVNRGADVDAELGTLIDECRADLISVGVSSTKANDETDGLILGAVRCFVRWKFGLNDDEAGRNREDYYTLKDDLRKKEAYQCTSETESS